MAAIRLVFRPLGAAIGALFPFIPATDEVQAAPGTMSAGAGSEGA